MILRYYSFEIKSARAPSIVISLLHGDFDDWLVEIDLNFSSVFVFDGLKSKYLSRSIFSKQYVFYLIAAESTQF